MRLSLSLIISVIMISTACTSYYCDEPVVCEGTPMVLQNYTGLDGCGWVLTDGKHTYEPVNLGDFNIPLQEGTTVYVALDTLPDVGSICMVGPVVSITCLTQKTMTTTAY